MLEPVQERAWAPDHWALVQHPTWVREPDRAPVLELALERAWELVPELTPGPEPAAPRARPPEPGLQPAVPERGQVLAQVLVVQAALLAVELPAAELVADPAASQSRIVDVDPLADRERNRSAAGAAHE